MEDVFIVSAARTPLGSMEGCLKVGSTLHDDVKMINIYDITWHWWHWWPGCDSTPAWEQGNPSLSWESWYWAKPGGGSLHGLCTSGLPIIIIIIIIITIIIIILINNIMCSLARVAYIWSKHSPVLTKMLAWICNKCLPMKMLFPALLQRPML